MQMVLQGADTIKEDDRDVNKVELFWTLLIGNLHEQKATPDDRFF